MTILGTSSQQQTRFRNQGAYLLWWNGEGLLFDPGEGTQRQLIFANIAPTVITRIFISHFHGDHCLGLSSIFLRLNLDKVTHTIHCYYPAEGKKYFDRLRYSTIYRDHLCIEEHPVSQEGVVHSDEAFTVKACFLKHTVPNLAWRIEERDERKFDRAKLEQFGICGPLVKQLFQEKSLCLQERRVSLDEVSWMRKGSAVAVVLDTLYCEQAIEIAQNAALLLCESTYARTERELARRYLHLTAEEAGMIAKAANAKLLVLTHFSARYLSTKSLVEEARVHFPNSYAAREFATFRFAKEKP